MGGITWGYVLRRVRNVAAHHSDRLLIFMIRAWHGDQLPPLIESRMQAQAGLSKTAPRSSRHGERLGWTSRQASNISITYSTRCALGLAIHWPPSPAG